MWTYVQPALEHWLTSAFLGWLAYSWTSTISRSWFSVASRSHRTTYSTTQVDRCIGRLSYAAGFTSAIASHLAIDYVIGHGWLA